MLTLNSKVNDSIYDLEDQYDETFAKQMRMGFIRRVYGLLSAQFILTCLVVTTMIFTKGIKGYLIHNYRTMISLVFISSILSVVILLICRFSKTDYMRQYPINLVILFTISFFEALPIGCLCIILPSRNILIALIATAVTVIGITIYALQTKYDFTSYTSLLLYGSIGLSVACLINLFIPYSRPFEILLGSAGAIFYAFILLLLTQSIIGKHENIVYEDDYVYAALMLHLSILDLFIYILKIVNAVSGVDNH
ncbi:hypothetical protein ACR3K2_20150 [Cryptosporidium serpentis]